MPTSWAIASRYRSHHVANSRGGGSERSAVNECAPNAPVEAGVARTCSSAR
jgi:hypothetical protein